MDTPRAGFLVLNDVWHPWWFGSVDGKPADILRANVLFRAIEVPAGKHVVRFDFRPVEGRRQGNRGAPERQADRGIAAGLRNLGSSQRPARRRVSKGAG